MTIVGEDAEAGAAGRHRNARRRSSSLPQTLVVVEESMAVTDVAGPETSTPPATLAPTLYTPGSPAGVPALFVTVDTTVTSPGVETVV